MTLDLRAAAVALRWGIAGCVLVMLVACGMLRATGASFAGGTSLRAAGLRDTGYWCLRSWDGAFSGGLVCCWCAASG